MPNNKYFPERDHAYMADMSRRSHLLITWLEAFKTRFMEMEEAQPTFQECEVVLQKYDAVVGRIKVPLEIRGACEEALGYGLSTFLKKLDAALQQGPPSDACFPERDEAYLMDMTRRHDALTDWVEHFKSRFQRFEQAQPTIKEVDAVLNKWYHVVGRYKLPIEIARACRDRSAELPSGLDHALASLSRACRIGPSQSFEAHTHWTAARKQQAALTRWLERFRLRYGRYTEAAITISRCEEVLKVFETAVPLLYQRLPVQPTAISKGVETTKAADGEERAVDLDSDSEPELDVVQAVIEGPEAPVKITDHANSDGGGAAKVGPTICADSIDRMPPANLEGGESTYKELLKKEIKLQQRLGKDVLLCVDWQSVTACSTFAALSLEEQKAQVAAMGFGLCSTLLFGRRGLVSLCDNCSTIMDAIQRHIAIVELAINNSTDGVVAHVREKNTLVLTHNWASATKSSDSGLEEALLTAMDLHVVRAIALAERAISASAGSLQRELKRVEPMVVRLDWGFTRSPTFLSSTVSVRVKMVTELGAIAQRAVSGSSRPSVSHAAKNDVTRNLLVQNVSAIEVTYDMDTKADVLAVFHDPARHLLRIVCPTSDHTFPTQVCQLSHQIEVVLGITVTKAAVEARVQLRASENIWKRRCGSTVRITADWARWMLDTSFVALPPEDQAKLNNDILRKHLRELLNSDRGLIKFCEKSSLRALICRKVRKIVVCYEPPGIAPDVSGKMIATTTASGLVGIALTRRKTLRLHLRMPRIPRDSPQYSEGFHTALETIFRTASIKHAIHVAAVAVAKAVAQKSGAGEMMASVTADWAPFARATGPVSLKTATHLHTVLLPALTTQLQEVCAHPLGSRALRECVSQIAIHIGAGAAAPTHHLNKDDKVLRIQLGYGAVLVTPALVQAWQVRWALGCAIPVAQAIGQARLDSALVKARAVVPNLALELDWAFVTHPDFLAMGGQATVAVITTLAHKLVPNLLSGVLAVCDHPIGLKCVVDNIAALRVVYSPTSAGGTDSTLQVDGNTIVVGVNPETLMAGATSRYKERIEFEFDLIVAIAQDNAKQRQAVVAEAIRRPISVDLSFSKLPDFKARPPADQADIITTLCATLPEAALADTRTGLLAGLAQSQCQEQFTALAPNSVVIRVDSAAPSEGTVAVEDRQLVFSFAEDYVLKCRKLCNWKERCLSALGVLVLVARAETHADHEEVCQQVRSGLGAQIPIGIDWDSFTSSAAFCSLHPTIQTELIKTANVQMLRTTLLGNEGFTGSHGLCEFPEVVAAILSAAPMGIAFSISPDDDGQPTVGVAGGIMTIRYSLGALARGTFEGCHAMIEAVVALRPIKEAASISRGTHTVTTECGVLPVQVRVEWSAVQAAAVFKAEHPYSHVRAIDRLAGIPAVLLTKPVKSFGDCGLTSLMANTPTLEAAVRSQVKAIVVEFDASNNTRRHWGMSKTLNPHNLQCELDSDGTLKIKLNYNSQPTQLWGAGRVVHFVLCPAEAQQAEQREMQRRSEELRRHEVERRARCTAREQERRTRDIQRVQRRNEEIDRDNARAQERYQRDMQEYHKKCNQTCIYSQCGSFGAPKGRNKCGRCNGRGHNTNNKITRTCSSCKGLGHRPCQTCRGTNKRYPNGPSQPSVPRARSKSSLPVFGSMPTFGPMPNFLDQI